MRLNMDCVRDILLCVEENTGLRQSCRFVDSGLHSAYDFLHGSDHSDIPAYESALIEKYENDMLIYHVHYCVECGLLSAMKQQSELDIVISDLTPQGHSFLENIREDKLWNRIKGISENVGSKSLDAFISISSNVVSELVKSQFGI